MYIEEETYEKWKMKKEKKEKEYTWVVKTGIWKLKILIYIDRGGDLGKRNERETIGEGMREALK